MSDAITQRANIDKKFDELKRTSPRHSQFKARLGSLPDLIKQVNYHFKIDVRLVEVSQYPSVYELKEVEL